MSGFAAQTRVDPPGALPPDPRSIFTKKKQQGAMGRGCETRDGRCHA